MSDDRPYIAADLARKLGVTLDHFYRCRQVLHDRDGLPPPLTGGGRLRWSRPAVDAWLDPRTRGLPVAAADAKTQEASDLRARDEALRYYASQR